MLFQKKSGKPQNRIDSLIGAGTTISGDITFVGGLRIDGHVKGNLRTADNNQGGTLVLSEHALVEGEINVSHLVVNGTVHGPVHATEFLELQPHARVTGDVEYNNIEMHLGAVVQGRLIHQGVQGKAVELKLASSNN
jgi:cytoskeletal protein CcmA (bactofilin family)